MEAGDQINREKEKNQDTVAPTSVFLIDITGDAASGRAVS
jgi:hypothetical protein